MHLLYNRGNIRKGTLYKKESENDIDHNKRNIYMSKKYKRDRRRKKCIMYFSTLKLFLFDKQSNSFGTGNECNRKT